MGFEGNIKKGAESSIQALRDGTNVVFSEVSKLLKISEKKIDINSYKKKIEKNYTTLGELIHRYLTDGVTNPLDQAEVREVLQNIYRYKEKIQTLTSEIEIIRSMKPVEQENHENLNGERTENADDKEEGETASTKQVEGEEPQEEKEEEAKPGE